MAQISYSKSNLRKKAVYKKDSQDNMHGYAYLMPWLFGFLAFTVFPMIYTFYLSFNDVKLTVLGWEVKPAGIGNYVTALLRNIQFTPALSQFLLREVIYVPTVIVISFILAVLLNQNIKFKTTFRVIYFLPVIVLSSSVMQQLMDSGSTRIDNLTDIFIIRIIATYSPLLANGLYILFQNFSLVLWFTGIPIILFINGLQKIDRDIFEAARIDGATPWQILWKITIPMIKGIALVSTIFTIVQLGTNSMNPAADIIKDAIFNTTGGLGLASAYAYVYSTVVLILIGVAFLLFRSRNVD